MSSSAAVEEAIQEILPGESINEDNLYPLSNTPPSQSENDSLGLTPVPSPRVTTSMPSPHPSNAYSSSPKAASQAAALPQWGKIIFSFSCLGTDKYSVSLLSIYMVFRKHGKMFHSMFV